MVKLSDFRGTPVVVYFYPKADTPGSFRSIHTARRGEETKPMASLTCEDSFW